MASPTYSVRGLVLKRTKLGESDVIVSFLLSNGSQAQAVAKGARKPTSSFSSRLELFCVCDLLLVKGRSLDIVKEARLVEGFAALRGNVELTVAASPILELVLRTTFPDQENEHLFDMVQAALRSIASETCVDANLLAAAAMLKAVALLGFRPSFTNCVCCGSAVAPPSAGETSVIPFSYLDGGAVCAACEAGLDAVPVKASVIGWANALLYGLFREIETLCIDGNDISELLRLLQTWINAQIQVKLKSLDFLLAYYGW